MPAASTPRWTREEIAILKEAYPKGMKTAFEALPHRSVYSINVKAHRLGLKVERPHWHGRAYSLSGADLEEAMKLREAGWSFLKIGAKFGVAECSASNAINKERCVREGYTPATREPGGRLTEGSRERLRWMLKKGLKGVEIQLRLGVSAACVHNERTRYNAELKERGKAPLPPPGNGESYSGARVPKEKRKEAERLFLAGYGTLKVSRQSGVSKTVCTRIRKRLIEQLKRKDECLTGCDADGKRRTMRDHSRCVPDEIKAKLKGLILSRVPVRRAAKMCGMGTCTAYKIRDELKASGIDVPKPRLPGRVKPLKREMLEAQAIPSGQIWRYRTFVRELGDADKARAALRAETAAVKDELTFEDKLKLVADGKVGISKVEKFKPADHDFTLGGVSAGMMP